MEFVAQDSSPYPILCWSLANRIASGLPKSKMIHSLDILGLFSFQPLVAAENTDIHRLSGRSVFLALKNTVNDSQFQYFALIWSQTACNIVADKTCFLNIDKTEKWRPALMNARFSGPCKVIQPLEVKIWNTRNCLNFSRRHL